MSRLRFLDFARNDRFRIETTNNIVSVTPSLMPKAKAPPVGGAFAIHLGVSVLDGALPFTAL